MADNNEASRAKKRLVITRKHNQGFYIDETLVRVNLSETRGRQARIVIEADESVAIQREELRARGLPRIVQRLKQKGQGSSKDKDCNADRSFNQKP